tara:strand:+ start:19472 stop:21142 length:1671 start_codon:yes stop_codon:yes gene_type:complete
MLDNKEYKVLARKYRPQKFSDLIGQDAMVKILKNSILNNRIAHAYILTGVRGVGKTTTARIIAMSLNCQKKQNVNYEPCEECDSCISIRSDRNLDVIEMDAASKTGVEDIRDIIDNVKYKPVSSKYKIFIIDEVHMLSKNAFNALLKTLEEPPSHTKFIFATTEVKKIPVTILSRCQRFDLNRIDNSTLKNKLSNIANLENVKIENDALSLIVRAADGSVRDALSILDQAISNYDKKIESKTILEMLGLADRGKIFDLMDKIFQGNTLEALNIYQSLYKSGADVIMIFDEMLNTVHFLTQIKISPDLKEDHNFPELERVRGLEISSKISMASLGLVWQVLFKGFQELQNTLHLFQHGEMLILRLIFIHNGPGPSEILKKNFNESNEYKKNLTNEINKNDISKNVDVKNDLNLKNFKSNISVDSYRKFVDLFFKKKEAILHAQLYNDVKLISFEEGNITLNVEKIHNSQFIRNITKLISKWTGRIWQIHSSSGNLGQSLNEEDIINQQKEIEKIRERSEIKNLLKVFSGVKIHSITDLAETKDEKYIDKKINDEKEG